jgi:hypothetical protein
MPGNGMQGCGQNHDRAAREGHQDADRARYECRIVSVALETFGVPNPATTSDGDEESRDGERDAHEGDQKSHGDPIPSGAPPADKGFCLRGDDGAVG